MRRFLTSFMVLGCIFLLTACTSSVPEGKPMPELTFQHIAPFAVNVGAVEVENRYDSSSDPNDVSSSFPTPPDILLRRYAENRLQPAGGEGVLKFIIEGVNVHHSLVQPAGNLSQWMGINRKDLYEVNMKIRMYELSPEGREGTHSILNMERSIAIPQSYSVADKEREKFNFLELLMKDVDTAVIQALKEKMNLAGL